eukprot:GHVR01083671.1.p1 GENE.GHVR01083671.1~~GHVR01083671.1.p1  ORF type:complete len:1039 (+),score=149.47 GHVR01083671.1:448-3564(+)
MCYIIYIVVLLQYIVVYIDDCIVSRNDNNESSSKKYMSKSESVVERSNKYKNETLIKRRSDGATNVVRGKEKVTNNTNDVIDKNVQTVNVVEQCGEKSTHHISHLNIRQGSHKERDQKIDMGMADIHVNNNGVDIHRRIVNNNATNTGYDTNVNKDRSNGNNNNNNNNNDNNNNDNNNKINDNKNNNNKNNNKNNKNNNNNNNNGGRVGSNPPPNNPPISGRGGGGGGDSSSSSSHKSTSNHTSVEYVSSYVNTSGSDSEYRDTDTYTSNQNDSIVSRTARSDTHLSHVTNNTAVNLLGGVCHRRERNRGPWERNRTNLIHLTSKIKINKDREEKKRHEDRVSENYAEAYIDIINAINFIFYYLLIVGLIAYIRVFDYFNDFGLYFYMYRLMKYSTMAYALFVIFTFIHNYRGFYAGVRQYWYSKIDKNIYVPRTNAKIFKGMGIIRKRGKYRLIGKLILSYLIAISTFECNNVLSSTVSLYRRTVSTSETTGYCYLKAVQDKHHSRLIAELGPDPTVRKFISLTLRLGGLKDGYTATRTGDEFHVILKSKKWDSDLISVLNKCKDCTIGRDYNIVRSAINYVSGGSSSSVASTTENDITIEDKKTQERLTRDRLRAKYPDLTDEQINVKVHDDEQRHIVLDTQKKLSKDEDVIGYNVVHSNYTDYDEDMININLNSDEDYKGYEYIKGENINPFSIDRHKLQLCKNRNMVESGDCDVYEDVYIEEYDCSYYDGKIDKKNECILYNKQIKEANDVRDSKLINLNQQKNKIYGVYDYVMNTNKEDNNENLSDNEKIIHNIEHIDHLKQSMKYQEDMLVRIRTMFDKNDLKQTKRVEYPMTPRITDDEMGSYRRKLMSPKDEYPHSEHAYMNMKMEMKRIYENVNFFGNFLTKILKPGKTSGIYISPICGGDVFRTKVDLDIYFNSDAEELFRYKSLIKALRNTDGLTTYSMYKQLYESTLGLSTVPIIDFTTIPYKIARNNLRCIRSNQSKEVHYYLKGDTKISYYKYEGVDDCYAHMDPRHDTYQRYDSPCILEIIQK